MNRRAIEVGEGLITPEVGSWYVALGEMDEGWSGFGGRGIEWWLWGRSGVREVGMLDAGRGTGGGGGEAD